MSSPAYQSQQYLETLCAVSRAMAQRISETEGPSAMAEAARSHIIAECIECGIRITGTELLALGAGSNAAEPDPRLKRLRLGYCARNGCKAIYYRIVCTAHPEIEWSAYVTEANAQSEPVSSGQPAELNGRRFTFSH